MDTIHELLQNQELELQRIGDDWMLGDTILKPGDVIEVMIDNQWYVARIEFAYEMNEYQLQFPLVSMPLCEKDIARWPLEFSHEAI